LAGRGNGHTGKQFRIRRHLAGLFISVALRSVTSCKNSKSYANEYQLMQGLILLPPPVGRRVLQRLAGVRRLGQAGSRTAMMGCGKWEK
jgi:hypothetical protein